MEISPWGAIALNILYAIVTGLTVPVVDALGFTGHDAQIVAWAGIAAVPLNMIIHSLSSSTPGPLAPADPPVVQAAQKVADLPPTATPATVAQTKKIAQEAVVDHQP